MPVAPRRHVAALYAPQEFNAGALMVIATRIAKALAAAARPRWLNL